MIAFVVFRLDRTVIDMTARGLKKDFTQFTLPSTTMSCIPSQPTVNTACSEEGIARWYPTTCPSYLTPRGDCAITSVVGYAAQDTATTPVNTLASTQYTLKYNSSQKFRYKRDCFLFVYEQLVSIAFSGKSSSPYIR